MTSKPMKPIIKPLLLLLPLFLILLFILRTPSKLSTSPAFSPSLKIRPGYTSYDAYIKHQLNKTLNPHLRRVWTTRDWDRKVRVFSLFFSDLKSQSLLSNSSKALCIGARMGQEVAALRAIGVVSAIGMDLVPNPPLVVAGDFHSQPFPDSSFDFEFSNVFDHALYPDRFAAEIERTLRPSGVCVLHVTIKHKGDKYSANDLSGIDGVVMLFKRMEVVRVREVDGFGLDTEIVFKKKPSPPPATTTTEK
ncbi:24-methylenesterol C-methyltransferase protein [Dioscorea alata]|uniref:24-methylenesterol C-methyltransferase protein n=1 Tax=Dioscorea alata TaxID=55571 RepID=A0ACB7VAN1_DIOAL|nr:24-methylenesterol C-methyltransferase protein [Dioscorea alata]